jgi:tripartite-type tricarboxylate transporter receptor subunit TctC
LDGTHIIARTLGEKLSKELKGSFVVENRPGASSTMAADMTAQPPADGHTLLLA